MITFRPINLATDLPVLVRLLSLTMPEPLTVEQVRERSAFSLNQRRSFSRNRFCSVGWEHNSNTEKTQ